MVLWWGRVKELWWGYHLLEILLARVTATTQRIVSPKSKKKVRTTGRHWLPEVLGRTRQGRHFPRTCELPQWSLQNCSKDQKRVCKNWKANCQLHWHLPGEGQQKCQLASARDNQKLTLTADFHKNQKRKPNFGVMKAITTDMCPVRRTKHGPWKCSKFHALR